MPSVTLADCDQTDQDVGRILKNKPLMIDGGMGTLCQDKLGEDFSAKHKLWNAELLHSHPEIITAAHKEFILAGADVVISCSYQAHFDGNVSYLSEHAEYQECHDMFEEFRVFVQKSVLLAKNAIRESKVERDVFVAGSCGCFGASLGNRSEYTGDYKCDRYPEGPDVNELVSWHSLRFDALVEGNADIIAFESIPNIIEARAIVELLKQKKPKTPVWVTFTCNSESNLNSGEKLELAVRICDDCKYVNFVGVNCTSPFYITKLLEIVGRNTDKPLVVYPNSGGDFSDPDDHGHRTAENVFNQLLEEKCGSEKLKFDFAQEVARWLALGVKFIGGCCDSTPQHMELLKSQVEKYGDVQTADPPAWED